MAAYRILDTNPATVDDVVTFGTYAAMFASINTEFPSSPGIIDVRLRNSSGVDCVERMLLNNVTTGVRFTAEFANGFPFVQSEPADALTTTIFNINDDNSGMSVTEEGAGIIRANPGSTGVRHLLNVSKVCLGDGWILDGNGVDTCGGVTGEAAATLTNMKFINIARIFEGAIRGSNVIIDHCTFVGCVYIRMSGPITNSLFIQTKMNEGGTTGVIDGSDFNVYDVPLELVSYAGPGTADGNSIYSANDAKELLIDKWGARDVRPGSFLAGVSSTGGPVGANTDKLTPKATIIGDITRGLTFDIILEGYRSTGSINDVEVYVKDTLGVVGVVDELFPCTVTVNEHFKISATAPTTAVLTAALTSATVIVRPIDV